MNIFDRLLLQILRRRLARPDFLDAVGREVLSHHARVKAEESAERDAIAHQAVRILARKIEVQRYVTDCEGITTPSPLQ